MSGAGAGSVKSADSIAPEIKKSENEFKQTEFDFSVVRNLINWFDRIDTLVWSADVLGHRIYQTPKRKYIQSIPHGASQTVIATLLEALNADTFDKKKAALTRFLAICTKLKSDALMLGFLKEETQDKPIDYDATEEEGWQPLKTDEEVALLGQFQAMATDTPSLLIAMCERQFNYYSRFDTTSDVKVDKPLKNYFMLLKDFPLLCEAIREAFTMPSLVLAENPAEVMSILVDSFLQKTTSDEPTQNEVNDFINHACIKLFIGKQWDEHFFIIKQLIESALNAFRTKHLRELIKRSSSSLAIKMEATCSTIGQLLGGFSMSMSGHSAAINNRAKARALLQFASEKTRLALKVHPVPPHGNCLWEALVHQMQIIKLDDGQSIAQKADITDYASLKSAIADFLKTEEAKAKFGNLGELLEEMQRSAQREGAWGENVHMHFVQAFLTTKGINCQFVFSQHSFEQPGFEVLTSPDRNENAPALAIIYYDRAHYDSMVRTDEEGNEHPLTPEEVAQLVSLDCKGAPLDLAKAVPSETESRLETAQATPTQPSAKKKPRTTALYEPTPMAAAALEGVKKDKEEKKDPSVGIAK